MSLTLTGFTPSFGSYESAYTSTFTASGGTTPYTYSVSSGSLPPGVSLDASTGVVSGTPTSNGTYSFVIEVTDAVPDTATFSAEIIVASGWCVINEPSIGLTDRSNYLWLGDGQNHSFGLQLRKRGQATIPFYIPAGDSYAPTQFTPIYLCDVTESGVTVTTTGTGGGSGTADPVDPASWTKRSFSANVDAISLYDQVASTAGSYSADLVKVGPGSNGNQDLFCTMIALKPSGGSAGSFVQANSYAASTNVSTLSVAFNLANTAGNCLVVDFGFTTQSLVSIADALGNTYTQAEGGGGSGGAGNVYTYIAPNCAAGTNVVTLTLSGLAEGVTLGVSEYSGIATSSPVDVGTWGFQYSPDAGSETLSVTTTGTNELLHLYAFVNAYHGTTSTTVTSESQIVGAVWSGLIQNLEYKWLNTAGDRICTITAVSFESVFDTVYCPPKLYLNKTCGYIVRDLLSTLESGCPVVAGIIADGETLPQFETSYEKVSEVFDKLATSSLYTWGVNPQTAQLFFQTPTTIPAPFTLTNDLVLWDSVVWKLNGSDYRNRQAGKLSYDAFEHSKEFFVGAGQTTFTLMRPVQQVTNAWATLATCNTATISFSGQPSAGDTVTIGPASGAWQESHIYGPGGIIVINGYVFKITYPSSGTATSGATEPTWLYVTGDTIIDGSVIWTCQGPLGISTGQDTYTFVTSLDNTQAFQVLIGATTADSVQNLFDAMNANAAVRGTTFSLPTWECSQCNAISNSGTSFTAQQKSAGTGWVAAVSAVSTNISWSSANTTGGTSNQGSLGPNEGGTIELQVYAAGTSTASPAVQYTPGSAVITLATPLNVGSNLNVEYTRADGNIIECENTSLVTALATVSHGTGKYQQIMDLTSQGLLSENSGSGLIAVQTALEAYSVSPQSFEFDTYQAGLFPGMIIPVSLSLPTGGTTLLNGTRLGGFWIIEEIKAEMIPAEPYITDYGHYRYSISMVDFQEIGSYQDFCQGLGGSGSGGSGASGALVATSGGAQSTTGEPTLQIEVNGTDAGSQAVLNLVPGAHITISDDGVGDITIAGTTPMTTKGDLYVFGSSATRLPVGTNGQVLTSRSSATDGVDWETLPTATTSNLGMVEPDGTTITVSSGVISVPTGTSSTAGVLKPDGTTIVASSGVISAVTATTGNKGIVEPDGVTIDISSGVISVPTATNSTLGVVKVDGSTVTISGGVISSSGGGNIGGVNAQTADYTAVSGDDGKIISFTSSSLRTLTLPSSPPSSKWKCFVESVSGGLNVLTTETIDPSSWTKRTFGAGQDAVITYDLPAATTTTYSVTLTKQISGQDLFGTLIALKPSGSSPGVFVQGKTQAGTAAVSTVQIAFNSNNTAGNCLVADFTLTGSASVTSIADSNGNSYTLAQGGAASGGSGQYYTYVAPNCAAGANTVTLTLSAAVTSVAMSVSEYSGVATSSPVDVGTKNFSYSLGVTSFALSVTTTGTNRVLHLFSAFNTYSAVTGTLIDGSNSVVSALAGQGLYISTDGTNYFTSRGEGSGGGSSSVPTATTSNLGLVEPDGVTIDVSAGVISVPTATTSALGLVKPDGTSVDISSGVISVPTATTSLLGLVKPDGSTVTISSGVISAAGGIASLTTTGSSGAATFSGGTLNIPQYSGGGGSGALTQISQITVSGSSTSAVTFSSIPGTYSGLILKAYGTVSDAVTQIFVALTFNGDTGSNYYNQYVNGNLTNPGAAYSNHAYMQAGLLPGTSGPTAHFPGSFVVDIPGYANTAFYKSALSTTYAPAGTTSFYILVNGCAWASLSAITSITLTDGSGGHFIAGTTFTLYGEQ